MHSELLDDQLIVFYYSEYLFEYLSNNIPDRFYVRSSIPRIVDIEFDSEFEIIVGYRSRKPYSRMWMAYEPSNATIGIKIWTCGQWATNDVKMAFFIHASNSFDISSEKICKILPSLLKAGLIGREDAILQDEEYRQDINYNWRFDDY